MGVTLRSDVDASAFAKKAITAVSRSLLGMWFFDSSLAKAKNDFGITSDAASSVIGAPAVSADRTRFLVGQNFLQTNIPEPEDMTFAMVVRSVYSSADMAADVNKQAFACGNYESVTGVGSSGLALGYANPASGRLSFGRVLSDGSPAGVQAVALAASIDSTQWQLVWGTYTAATGTVFVRAETANIDGASRGGPGYAAVKNPRPISIGYAGGFSQKGPVEISQLRLYGAVLDRATEIGAIVAEMRRYELTHNNRVV